MFRRKRSKLRLVWIVMSKDGRVWVRDGVWGDENGVDVVDAMCFKSRAGAEKYLAGLDVPGDVYEIGLYNGRPVMLVDAYDYWLDARYSRQRGRLNASL